MTLVIALIFGRGRGESTAPVPDVINTTLIDNMCAGQLTNRPDIFQ